MPDQPTQEQLKAEYELPDSDAVEVDDAPPSEKPRNERGQFVKPTEPVKPTHSPRSLRQAQKFGYSQEDIDRYTPDQLEAALDRDLTHFLAERERVNNRDIRNNEPSGVPLEFADDPPKKPATAASAEDEVDLDDFDPKLVKVVKSLQAQNKALLERLDKIEPRLEGVHNHVQEQVYLTRQQQSDKWFKDHADVYGSAIRSELTDDSTELLKRSALDALAIKLQKKGDTIATAYDRAHRVLYDDKPAPAQPTPPVPAPPSAPSPPAAPTARQQEWDRGGIAAPSQQVPPEEPKGRSKAIRTANTLIREMAHSNGTEHSELPD